MNHQRSIAWLLAALMLVSPGGAFAQGAGSPPDADQGIQLDFEDVELSVVVDTIARVTGKNFIYDDKVRGRVTVISPSRMNPEQAYAVFESILQVKGFTTVAGPGGVLKIIPIRDAKESSIETVPGRGPSPNRDLFVTRLIPLRYIDAEAITNTLKPLVSKEALMVAYAPTNTVILTDSAANIRRLLGILDSIDVETHKEELAVIKVRHADASTLADQLSQIYDAETSSAAATPATRRRRTARRTTAAQPGTDGADVAQHGRVHIITDDRTNSLIVLASRSRLEDIRKMIARLDIPVIGGGRIHVYYLNHANAEELANVLSSLISGQPAAGGAGGPGGARAEALRAAVTELAEGVTVTADPATNSLVIQASQEGYRTLSGVIELLDIPRPQVLVEALIMEVTLDDNDALGFSGLLRLVSGSQNGQGALVRPFDIAIQSATGGVPAIGTTGPIGALANILRQTFAQERDANGNPTSGPQTEGTLIQGVIQATADNSDTNIISAPHILTSDNEEAEIRIGDNIPLPTSRVDSSQGQTNNLATSVNLEREDIGVTLRVTPQITEGNTLRLDIFQELTAVNTGLSLTVAAGGSVADTGVALSNRRIENTVSVADGETVVIGGLISDDYQETLDKVPFLGDIPVLGWLFKSETRNLIKKNLLVFLTPHIVRRPEDLELETIRKREEFRQRSVEALELTEKERKEDLEKRLEAEELGIPFQGTSGRRPARKHIVSHEERYPLERMREIEEAKSEEMARIAAAAQAAAAGPQYNVLAAVFSTEGAAATTLTDLLDAGLDGIIVAGQTDGAIYYQVVVGPYKELDEAQDAAIIVKRSFNLEPSVMIAPPEPAP